MAVLERLIRTACSWRRIASPKTLTLNLPRDLPPPPPLYPHLVTGKLGIIYMRFVFIYTIDASSSCTIGLDIQQLRLVTAASGSYYILPVVLAGLLGVGVVEKAYADANKVTAKPPLPSKPPASHVNLEETAEKERQRIEWLLKVKGIKSGSYPQFTVAVKGQKVTTKFQIPPSCEVEELIAYLVSKLGLKAEGSDMLLHAWDRTVSWWLTLNPLKKQKETGVNEGHSVDRNRDRGDLSILVFRPLIKTDRAVIEFIKEGSLNPKELDALVSTLKLAGEKLKQRNTMVKKPREASSQKSIAGLEDMGVRIYGLDAPHQHNSYSEISWDNITGYDQQKRLS
ncbi:hypothetical protein REPUB_Repub14bG0153600 [Reevesia pubescens]